MEKQVSLDAAMLRSLANPTSYTLTAATGTISGNPKRLGMVFYAHATDTYRLFPFYANTGLTGGLLMSPGDRPLVLSFREWGSAVQNDMAIQGTSGDTVLYVEQLLHPDDAYLAKA